jgi:erythritol transport system ATP-binding protein
MSAPVDHIILEAQGLTKRYPGTVALSDVRFRVYKNLVNVLIGENGAGKSTLMRILAGVETADEGELRLDGVPVQVRSPREAAALGISIVHQELSVLANLDVAENVFAGREPIRQGFLLDRNTEDQRATQALRRLDEPLAVRTQTAHLSLGHRQIVEVARALDQGARILILDEPTSALSSAEAASLFRVLAELKRSGVTIIYISHRLHELLHLGDRFTVLRSGRVVGEAARAEVSRQWIVERMSGRAAGEESARRVALVNGPELLRVRGLALPPSMVDEAAQAPLHDVSFDLYRGEIVGIYGLLGAGRTELLECLAGSRRTSAGRIELNGKVLKNAGVAAAVASGIVLVPEDRQRDGLFPELSIRENITLASSRGPILRRTRQSAQARQLAQELNIAARDLELSVTALSGGNQQKVLIARSLMHSPSLLLLDEPTRGVDVNAKAEIYAILRNLADRGIGVLFTSSEIEETRALADRALVLCQGRISAELYGAEMTDETLFAAASPGVSGTTSIPMFDSGTPII